MVQLCAVVTKLGEVCLKCFVLLGSASTELAKDVLSADIRSSGVQAGLSVSHVSRGFLIPLTSVSNGSGPSLWVRVRVQTEPLPNWRSGSSINLNCLLGYGSMVNSQPV